MAEIRERNYRIDLPGDWSQVPSLDEGTFTYAEDGGTARLCVTLLGVRPMYLIADQRRLLGDYLHHRAQFEQGTTALAASEPSTSETGDAVEGEWSAQDEEGGRRLRHRVVLVSGLLADFRYEETGTDAEGFDARAGSVLATAAAVAPEG